MSGDGFGRYLATVQERDIDLLLMEEFHVSPPFVDWFCAYCGIEGATPDGAWHSVTDIDGETDLLLRVRRGPQRTAVLIENKINASEQDRQDERYHLRAARHQMEGKFDDFITCICAPNAYLSGVATTSLYQTRVSYEAIRDRFALSDDARSRWRAGVLGEAILQGRRGYRMIVNETITSFQRDFWSYLNRDHPELIMRRPTPKGNKSNWIMFRPSGARRGVGFHLKLDQCVVELGFDGRNVAELKEAGHELPEPIRLAQKGKTAALQLAVPPLDQSKPLADQQEALVVVMRAVAKLLPYSDLLA